VYYCIYNDNQIIIKVARQEYYSAWFGSKSNASTTPGHSSADGIFITNEAKTKTQAADATTNNEPRRAS
jgi:hypothetical protein|tara:strand:- start:171 stop:377 length:207 start_codon:yes stop_codon:yes gene_type:complete